MATIKEQEQLLAVLKFTPRTYSVSIWGYGGETYAGRIDRKVYNYFKENNLSIEEYANAWDEDPEIPEEFRPFEPGCPYDCDNIVHASGATLDDSSTIEISDENGQVVWSSTLDINSLTAAGVTVDCDENVDYDELERGTVIYQGSQGEKGTFYGGEFNLTQPFDPAKLTISYTNANGWQLSSYVYYDDEEIDNCDYSTNGKWSEHEFILLSDEPVFNPADAWEEPELGASPDGWEKSAKFNFSEHKPVHIGWYNANWYHGSTYGSLYWDGAEFGEWSYGKFRPVDQEGVVTWQGYNWDTSSWANQPQEPVTVICQDCGHKGSRGDWVEDEEYYTHCPSCNSTEWEWIEYDPDTEEGLANRAKYIKN